MCVLVYLPSVNNAKLISVTLERKGRVNMFYYHSYFVWVYSLSVASRMWVAAVVGERFLKAALSGCKSTGSAGWAMLSMSA